MKNVNGDGEIRRLRPTGCAKGEEQKRRCKQNESSQDTDSFRSRLDVPNIFKAITRGADALSCYHRPMTLNDLEFAYSPVRDQVRDLREYL